MHADVMSIRDILANNFRKIREVTASLSSPKDIIKAGAASNGTIGRIASKETGISIDKLEQLAEGYGLEAWQLLAPSINFTEGTDGMPIPDISCSWQFELVDPELYSLLTPAERFKAQVRMQDEIDALLAARKAKRNVRAITPPKLYLACSRPTIPHPGESANRYLINSQMGGL